MSEKWRMTQCSGKLITSVVVTLQSSVLEQDLVILIYEKYFHVSFLLFSEIRAWVCCHSTDPETCSQEKSISLLSRPVGQQVIPPWATQSLYAFTQCETASVSVQTWDVPGHDVCLKFVSCSILHTLVAYFTPPITPCMPCYNTGTILVPSVSKQHLLCDLQLLRGWGYQELYVPLVFGRQRGARMYQTTQGKSRIRYLRSY